MSFKGVNDLCVKVCPCRGSLLMVCTWLSHCVQPWSTRSSRGVHSGNTSAFCDENKIICQIKLACTCICTSAAVYRSVLPAPLDHPLRKWSLYSLHHSKMLLIVMSLQVNTDAHSRPCQQDQTFTALINTHVTW